MLEAMSCGLPVVTTRFGLHGLSVKDGRELVVADSPMVFAAAVKSLADDLGTYQALQDNARSYVEKIHPWAKVAAKVGRLFLHQHTRV